MVIAELYMYIPVLPSRLVIASQIVCMCVFGNGARSFGVVLFWVVLGRCVAAFLFGKECLFWKDC